MSRAGDRPRPDFQRYRWFMADPEAIAFASGDGAWDNAFYRYCWGLSEQAELGLGGLPDVPTLALTGQQPISTV